MAKTYINAKLQIVRANDDIVTASINTPYNGVGNGNQLAPERKSIWD